MKSPVNFSTIPSALRDRPQWVLWEVIHRDGEPTKRPLQCDGSPAKSNDPATWATFDAVRAAFDPARHAGIGFVFSPDDPLVGIDLDGCRDPQTGKFAEWAREALTRIGSYGEVSPSGTGAKVFCTTSAPWGKGRKAGVFGAEPVCPKTPAVEVYDQGRFFAVTGRSLKGLTEVVDATDAVAWVREKFFPAEAAAPVPDFHSSDAVVERARKYLAKVPGAVSGQGGHNATFHAACVLVLGFDLDEATAAGLLREWNQTCTPPWPDAEVVRKVREAAKQPGQRGYIRNVAPANWERVRVPKYAPPTEPAPPKSAPKVTTIVSASRQMIERIKAGETPTVGTSLRELDDALGGGLAFGEMCVFAARPSHGKSAFAMQLLHHWVRGPAAAPAVMISEEMSALALGKRTIQHISSVSTDDWSLSVSQLEADVAAYERTHAEMYIVENCGTAEAAAAAIERLVAEKGVRYAVVDYAQLLQSRGSSRYEQMTATSETIRRLASKTQVILVALCQLNRSVEKRGGTFMPVMSDIKETGQFEQDADVIAFLCWPHRLDLNEPKDRYQVFLSKNRDRGIHSPVVECKFHPERQMFLASHQTPDEMYRSSVARPGDRDDDGDVI